jgi:signal transduction histidine kinase
MSASAPTIAQKLPHRKAQPVPDSTKFRYLCRITIGVALLALGVGLYLSPTSLSRHLPEFGLWIAFVAIADLGALNVWRNVYLGLDFPVLLGAAFLFGPVFAGAVALVGSADPREFRREVSVERALFNRSQIALSVMAAGIVFQVTNGRVDAWPGILVPALAGLLADVFVNVSFVLLAQRTSFGLTWREGLAGFSAPGGAVMGLLTYAGYGLLALAFALLYYEEKLWAFVVFVAPVAMGRELFSRGKRIVESDAQLISHQKALRVASDRIQDERRDERARIASSLHDDVIQALYNVTLHAEVVQQDLKSGRLLALEEDVPNLVRASDAASALLREVVRDLRKSPLGRLGLRNTIELLLSHLADESGIKIEQRLEFIDPDPEQQLLIYQVVREAMTNAVRHSGASRIQIQLWEEPGSIRMSVEDDGIGFTSEPDGHFGLLLMKERAELAGGELFLETEAGGGTCVIAWFPTRREGK